MAKLGIRDKDYRPNQYINPMLISQGKEPAMGYGPYKIFDKNNPEHPDYKADEDDDEDIQLSLPIDYVHNRKDHDHTPDFQLPDGRDYYQSPNHEMMIPVDPSGNPIPELMNEEMLISQGPELGGTGRKLTLGEYKAATDNAFSNLMQGDMTDKDFEDYLRIKDTARRQLFDGV
tara:strand:+ start:252 stop:773 length:522 start_codon:yes stop_codon:yes gene_type:complete